MGLECESLVYRRWFSRRELHFEKRSVSAGAAENITNGNIRVTGLVSIDDRQAAAIFVEPKKYTGVLFEDDDDEKGTKLDLSQRVSIKEGQEVILTEKTLFRVRQVALAFEPSQSDPEPDAPTYDHGTHLPITV